MLAWAGFWAWFVVTVSLGEPPPPPWWIPVAWLSGLTALVLLAWKRPATGGLAFLSAGTWSAIYFANAGARMLLAAPAILLGVGFLALGRAGRSLSSAALLACALLLSGCFTPQDPADLPFQTRSILRHENGGMQRAFLLEETELGGFPCQGWVWWYEDGRLDNVELAQDLAVQGHDFPAGTRLFFDEEGRLKSAELSHDAVIDGLPCRGGMKISTAFHPNGRVRAFFPPDDLELDGVLCEASVFHPIYLHPDGRLQQCKLARDVTLDGATFEQGERLTLDESGRAVR
jgi:hypothetical protein